MQITDFLFMYNFISEIYNKVYLGFKNWLHSKDLQEKDESLKRDMENVDKTREKMNKSYLKKMEEMIKENER